MPEYRWWGSKDPRGRVKPAIVAAAPAAEVDADGTAVLRLYDPVDSWGGEWGVSAKEFAAALDGVKASSIRLHINSPGGEVYDAIAITNALRRHPANVHAVVDGIAASAASFIAASADRLTMAPNSELMIHDAWGLGIGPASALRDMADQLDRVSDNIASIYAGKAGGLVGDWRSLMLAETWLSAGEAVEAGLADDVEGAAGAGTACCDADCCDAGCSEGNCCSGSCQGACCQGSRAAWDLSMFRAAGRAAAGVPVLPRLQETDGQGDDGVAADRAARHARHRHDLAAARHGLDR